MRVDWHEKDRYGRILGDVFLDGRWINFEQVSEGWAWHYKEYNKSAVLADAETEAREAKLGLWADDSPTPPWDFDTRQRKHRAPPDGTAATSLADGSAVDETVYITETGHRYHCAGSSILIRAAFQFP